MTALGKPAASGFGSGNGRFEPGHSREYLLTGVVQNILYIFTMTQAREHINRGNTHYLIIFNGLVKVS